MRKSPGIVVAALLALLVLASAATAAPKGHVEVVQTSANLSQKLTRTPDLAFAAPTKRVHAKGPVIVINEYVEYQQFHGMGAALTDSSACLIARLSPGARDHLLWLLFSTEGGGIGLNFLRVPMGASDFSCTGVPYSYDDLPQAQVDDVSLSHFSVAHDEAYIIPILQQIVRINPRIQILANPWSAPPWMKLNGGFDNGLHLGVLPQASDPFLALYFQKFIEAYAAYGIHISAVTPINEPGVPTGYPSMELPEPDEASFITQYLQPALNGLGVKIYGYDSSWTYDYVNSLIRDVGNSLDGIAWHCYAGNPTVMIAFHKLAPDQIVDECSPEIRQFSAAEEAIASFRDWASTVAEWNVALDPSGGPVQPPNWGCKGCTGVVTVNPGGAQQVTFGSKYYQMGQVSHFVNPGAWRIESNNFVDYTNFPYVSGGLDDVAFLNPDGSKVLVVYNNSGHKIRFRVKWGGQFFGYAIPPHATTTFVW